MPVWGDAHRFAGEKRGFPASVLMAGERKQEGWGAGWHRHGATALPPSSIPLRSWRSLLQGADGAAAGRQTLRRLRGCPGWDGDL